MTPSVGSRLGPYEILAPLGADGMGEVYRARRISIPVCLDYEAKKHTDGRTASVVAG